MPIGFANSIFGTGAGSSASSNSFLEYDGSNDSTYDIDTLVGGSNVVQQWLGFCAFSDTHGVTASINATGGTRYINYHVLKNSNDTLTSPGNATGLNTGTGTYTNERGLLTQTNGGNILASFGPATTNDTQILSISGDSLTAHTAFDAGRVGGDNQNHFVYRQPGTNVFVTLSDGENAGYKFTLTENGDSSSISVGADVSWGENVDYHYTKGHFPGFIDANTMLGLADPASNNDGSKVRAVKFNYGVTGNQNLSTTALSGTPTSDVDLESADNYFQQSRSSNPAFYTTDFNDTSLFWERGGNSGNTAKVRVHAYKAGDTSWSRSNIMSLTAGTTSDTSFQGCFVGANNDVFLATFVQASISAVVVMKYVLSTNTLSEVFRISNSSSWDVEKIRIARWGDDRAILLYNNNKVRLLKP